MRQIIFRTFRPVRNLNTFYVVVFTFTIPSLQTGMASCLAMTAPGGISVIKPGCKKMSFTQRSNDRCDHHLIVNATRIIASAKNSCIRGNICFHENKWSEDTDRGFVYPYQ